MAIRVGGGTRTTQLFISGLNEIAPSPRCERSVPKESFTVTRGEATRWDGNGGAERYFCGTCGTGLYYLNDAVLPGIADIQSATLDEAAKYAPGAQIQCAERLEYMTRLGDMPAFDRFPPGIEFSD